MRPIIIPIFLPFQGCKGRCVFCNQHSITSQSKDPFSTEEIRALLRLNLASKKRAGSAVVAFYGGTFTANPISMIEELLNVTEPYRRHGLISSVRVSTRPDSLDREKLSLMKEYGVKTVELGVQSMDDRVLHAVGRGHGSKETIDAFSLLKQMGFEIGAQVMVGLPLDSPDGFMQTVEKIIALRPSIARIYPTLVIEGTKLAAWYRQGRYRPMELDDAVKLCARACRRFEDGGVTVIRIGLSPSPKLVPGKEIVAGPWHPGFGLMVRSAAYLEKCSALIGRFPGKVLKIRVPAGDVHLLRGFANRNISVIEEITSAKVGAIEADDSLAAGHLQVEVL